MWLLHELNRSPRRVTGDRTRPAMALDPDAVLVVYEDLSCGPTVKDPHTILPMQLCDQVMPEAVVYPVGETSRAMGCHKVGKRLTVEAQIIPSRSNRPFNRLENLVAECFEHLFG